MSDKQIKILIGDKFSLYRKGLSMAFADKGDIAIIGEADNGVQLLEMLERLSPDMIIADFTQKEIDGFEILPQIKQSYPQIKVIVLSLNEAPNIIIRMLESEADSYILKSSSVDTLYETIRQCYTHGFYLNNDTRGAIMSTGKTKSSEIQNKGQNRFGKFVLFVKSIFKSMGLRLFFS